jgi:hypothetical protein
MTRRQAWLLAGIIGAAAVVRFATLDDQSYDHDEAVRSLLLATDSALPSGDGWRPAAP